MSFNILNIFFISGLVSAFIYFLTNTKYGYESFKTIRNKIMIQLCKFRIIPPYSMIIDNLWLGNFVSSSDEKFLINKNIKLIVNLSKDLKFIEKNEEIKNIQFFRIPIHDNLSKESDNGLIEYFDNAYKIIDKHLENNEGVLIHCKAGMQRSATLVALYLMKKMNIKFSEAKKIIVSKRFVAFKPFIHFKNVIDYYSDKLDLN